MRHRFAVTISIATLAALIYAPVAIAQRGGFMVRPGPAGQTAWRGSFGMGGKGAFHPARLMHPNPIGSRRGWGWRPGLGYVVYPDYYGEPDYPPGITEASSRESDIQPAPAQPPERLPPSLVLELRGDQWVQVADYVQLPTPMQSALVETVKANPPRTLMSTHGQTPEPPAELPPAVLVYRDGHQEEVENYTIIGRTLYTRSNYWISGSWTRKIEIGDLDVRATLKLNQDRGSKFGLPSGPQEVVIR